MITGSSSSTKKLRLKASTVQKYSVYLPKLHADELAKEAAKRGREPLELLYQRYHQGREVGTRLERMETAIAALTNLIRLVVDDSATAAAHVRAAGAPPPERAEKVAALLAERRLEVAEILNSTRLGSDE